MKELDTQLGRLHHKLQLLIKQNQLLNNQNAALQKEKENLKASLFEKTELLQSLHRQVDILKLSSSALNEGEKKQLEKRISMYLTDIEKCLTLLNS